MRAATKDQLVIESAAPYCSKPTTRNFTNAAMKKRNSYINALNLHRMYCFFPSNDEHKSLFTNMQYTKKKTQRYKKKKITQEITKANLLQKSLHMNFLD